MIDELHVTDLALIRDVHFLPSSGLTAITGETGAGKTALLSALALLAGERADAGDVREGAPSLQVEGRFVFPQQPEGAPAEQVVSRQVTSDGRSRVLIDGAMASVGQLAEGPGASVDFCGQHEHQRLLHLSNHRALLDAWADGSIRAPLETWKAAWDGAEEAKGALDEVRAAGQRTNEALEQARFALERIDEVAPAEGEYDELRAALSRAENAEAIASLVGAAHDALASEAGALDAVGSALTSLEDAARTDPALAKTAESLRGASYVMEDVARDVRSYRDNIDFDAADLARMQERMGQLQGLMRSFGPTMEEVARTRQDAQDTIDAAGDFEARLSDAEAAYERAEGELRAAAEELHRARTAAAPRFADAVTEQMQRLDMGGCALACAVEITGRDGWTASGPDRVEFLFRPGQDLEPRPLVRIASGGEVSRVMLATKVVLGESDDVDTLVFDEVDAGVGGEAARALADVLADLAQTHQVIVVTHLAQVAVLAQTHYVVRRGTGTVAETTLEEVRGQARVAEVARMLSGDTSGVARTHAAQMLEDAHQLHGK